MCYLWHRTSSAVAVAGAGTMDYHFFSVYINLGTYNPGPVDPGVYLGTYAPVRPPKTFFLLVYCTLWCGC